MAANILDVQTLCGKFWHILIFSVIWRFCLRCLRKVINKCNPQHIIDIQSFNLWQEFPLCSIQPTFKMVLTLFPQFAMFYRLLVMSRWIVYSITAKYKFEMQYMELLLESLSHAVIQTYLQQFGENFYIRYWFLVLQTFHHRRSSFEIKYDAFVFVGKVRITRTYRDSTCKHNTR